MIELLLKTCSLTFLDSILIPLSPSQDTYAQPGKADEVVVVGSVIDASSHSLNSDNLNNNTIPEDADKGSSLDSIKIQVKTNGVSAAPTLESSSIPASPTSLKSTSSGSHSGNAMSSLGSGGEGSLELSLNMSVSQMRQMLAQKKKVDPKKVAMDLKQKYEIISSM